MMQKNTTLQNIQQIRRITWIGMYCNLLLSGIKFLVGILGNSQAVIADAIHSLSDMSTDLAVILGVKFWSAPPDDDHPYGHWRIESLVTTVIGLALLVVALGVGYDAIATIRHVSVKQAKWIALIGPLLSLVIKEVLYHWTVHVGRRTKSSAVIANAWHHRSDALSSIPALIAVTASALNPEWAFLDQIGALIVSLFIFFVSWKVIKPALAELIDRGATRKERRQIYEIAREVHEVQGVHAIRTRKFGSFLHVDLHILVEPEMSVRQGHAISEDVKQQLLAQGPEVLDVVVHLEPNDQNNVL